MTALLSQTAYHGSPYQFDRFSADAIGTGEGAASFGHGIYCGGVVEVGRAYSGSEGVAGAPVPTLYVLDGVRTMRGTPEQKAADLIYSGTIAEARKLAKSMLKDALNKEDWTQAKGLDYYRKIHEITLRVQKKSEIKKAPGVLYQVAIPPRDKMLDWDASMQAQNQLVTEVLGLRYTRPGRMKGEDAYRLLAEIKGGPKAASEFLLSLGIEGICYFDARSRGAQNGTRNFVVFDADAIHIEKVYDQKKKAFVPVAASTRKVAPAPVAEPSL
jgi:hypothetical protein